MTGFGTERAFWKVGAALCTGCTYVAMDGTSESDQPRPIFKHRGGPVDLFDENRLFLTLPSGHCQCSTAICNLPIINYSE